MKHFGKQKHLLLLIFFPALLSESCSSVTLTIDDFRKLEEPLRKVRESSMENIFPGVDTAEPTNALSDA